MKRLTISLIVFFLALPALAQKVQERVYVTTDRDWYAAGETVYLSAFCTDVSAGVRLSPVSAVAYVELTSDDGMALSGKVALFQGRGAGSLVLPRTLPSGNYRLSAYTRISSADPLAGSRIISVYNTLVTSRVSGGVTVGTAPASASVPDVSSFIQVRNLPDGGIGLTSLADASLSVSVFRNEPFPSYGSVSLSDALGAAPGPSPVQTVPEYDGEILYLTLTRSDGSPLSGEDSPEVFVSRPGRPEDLYPATVQPDGSAHVFTGNLFGSGNLVITLDEKAPAFRVQIANPFRELAPGSIPSLVLDPALAPVLSRLGARMQVTEAFDADTLYNRLPIRNLDFLQDENVIRYRLEDYTRFSTLQEVLTEYLSDIRSRRRGEGLELQVRCRIRPDAAPLFMEGPSLILVDGVPVLQHSLVLDLDPALVKCVDVYPYSYAVGNNVYTGIANFITYKGDMGGIRFGDNVRVVDYLGPAYPVAFGPSPDPGYPNQRETVLWWPMVDVKAGQELILPVLKTAEGLILVVEGLTADGTPVYFRSGH